MAPRSRFKVDRVTAALQGNRWSFSARIRNRLAPPGTWIFLISLWIEAESGRGERIAIETLEATAGQAESREDGRLWAVTIPDLSTASSVNGTSAPLTVAGIGVQGYRRVKVRLDIVEGWAS